MSPMFHMLAAALLDTVCIFGMIYAPPKTVVSSIAAFYAVMLSITFTLLTCGPWK